MKKLTQEMWKTPETKEKMLRLLAYYARQKRKNKVIRSPISEATKKKISLSLTGHKLSKETIEKQKMIRLGKSTKKRGRHYPHLTRENSPNWKGGKYVRSSINRALRKRTRDKSDWISFFRRMGKFKGTI